MKLIIEIPDKMYKTVQDGTYCGSLFEELKNGISVEQCGDCISREETLKALMDEWTEYDSELIGWLFEKIDKLPSVTAQPKMGRWIKCIDDNGSSYYLCSVCRCGEDFKFDWCPNCGAKMQEVQND